MIISFIAAMLILFLVGCSSGESTNQELILETNNGQKKDATLESHQASEELVQLHNHSNVKEDLLGVWASDNKEPLTIQISSDSIFYTEHFQSYKYRL